MGDIAGLLLGSSSFAALAEPVYWPVQLAYVLLASAAILSIAYFMYGRVLTRWLQIDPRRTTPAVELRDDVDYVPIEPKFLLSQHFSAIAAAGPIVGPILAGALFGWGPALIWILVGAALIGGVHDFTALVASIRHKARSIAEVVRDHLSPRSYLLFLTFVWVALVYIIVAFTDVTAGAFIGVQTLENGDAISGGGVASSSLMYLIIPIVMGVLLRYTRLSVGWATVIFLPLVAVSIWAGQKVPISVEQMLGMSAVTADARTSIEGVLTDEQKSLVPTTRARHNVMAFREKPIQDTLKLTDEQRSNIQTALKAPASVLSRARQIWNTLLLVYCVIASVLPMWLLLQPRGHLGGYFLYAALAVGAVGFVFGGQKAEYPAFRGWEVAAANGATQNLFPILFITIACGACSGFHSIIASGTTSKQLRNESDARPVGYGAMLLESMVAVISLCCVMMLKPDSSLIGAPIQPNLVYSNGIGGVFGWMGPEYLKLGVSFGLMAFTTFVYDTLDVCTRLGRYILQELTGWSGLAGQLIATIATAGAPLIFLLWQPQAANGQPAYMIFWALFGSSNQLLAALTLIGVTVWLWRTYRATWVVIAIGIPCVFMYIMSMWALVLNIIVIAKPLQAVLSGSADSAAAAALQNPVPWVALLLAGLGLLMLVEALWVMFFAGRTPPAKTMPQPVAA